MYTPALQNTRNENVVIVADLLEYPEQFDRIVDDPVLFEQFAKTLTDETKADANRLFFDDFTIELSLKDIVD